MAFEPQMFRASWHAAAAVFVVAAAACAQVGDDGWSDAFNRPGLAGRVFALGEYRGQLIAGGVELEGRGRSLSHVARLDGAGWQPIGSGVRGSVVRAISTFDGDLIVAGEFSSAGGRAASSIARWDGTEWRELGHGFGADGAPWGHVAALAVYRGELYAGGIFDRADGRSIAAVARWDGGRWRALGGGVSDPFFPKVLALQVAADGRLYVAGQFRDAGGTRVNGIASWDGSVWRPVGGGMTAPSTGVVLALHELAGSVVVAGSFDAVGGVAVANIARWDGSGWSPMGSGLPDGTVQSLRIFGGSLHAGGAFRSAGAVSARRIARWDGSAWQPIGAGPGGVDTSGSGTAVVLAMTAIDDVLYVGGDFTRAVSDADPQGAVVTTSVAGRTSDRWFGVGGGLGLGGEVLDAVRWHGGVVAVGRFEEAGGVVAARVAFLDRGAWRSLGTFDGDVHAAVIFADDLVVTGDFTLVDGRSIRAVARFDGARWSGMGAGAGGRSLAVYRGTLHVGGTDGAQRWNGVAWEPFGPPTDGSVLAMHEHGDRLFLGGTIRSTNVAGWNVVAWDGTSLHGVGGGTDGEVAALGSHAGELVAGGRFAAAGGVAARGVARFDGAGWRPLGAGLGGRVVSSVAELDGDLYAGGDFSHADGAPAEHVARWDGARWSPVGSGLDGPASALLADRLRGRVWVGGRFRSAGSRPSWNLARLDVRPDWLDLGGGLRGTAGVPRLSGHGSLIRDATVSFVVERALGATQGVFVLGASRVDRQLLGGTLVPSPDVLIPFATDGRGTGSWTVVVPVDLGAGAIVFVQAWLLDSGAPSGVAASNAVTANAP